MKTREDRGISLADYVQILWERRWLIAVIVILTTGFAFATRPEQPRSLHRSQVTLRVQLLSVTGSGTNTNPSDIPPAEIQAVRSPEVAATTAEELGMTDGGLSILERLEVSAIEGTDLMQVALQGRGAATSLQLQTYATNYIEYRNRLDQEKLKRALEQLDRALVSVQGRLRALSDEQARAGGASIDLQTRIDATTSIYKRFLELREQVSLDSVLAGSTIQQIGSPIEQRLGVLPTRTLRMIAGPIVGLILGAALAIALGVLRPRFNSRERAEERLGVPVLASIPLVKHHNVGRDPIVIQRASPWGVEGVRMLLAELQLLEKRGGRPVRVVVIASPEPGDGRTAIAVNLAASYAVARRSVALLRADRAVEVDETSRRDRSEPLDTLQMKIHRDGFAEVVPKVVRSRNTPGLVGDALNDVLKELAGDFDVVVVDTRPITASADSLLLAGQADAVVLVLRQHRTSEARAVESVEMFDRHDVKLIGMVMNAVRTPFFDRYRSRSARSRLTYKQVREAAPAEEGPREPAPRLAEQPGRQPQEEPWEARRARESKTIALELQEAAAPPPSPELITNGDAREPEESVARSAALPPDGA